MKTDKKKTTINKSKKKPSLNKGKKKSIISEDDKIDKVASILADEFEKPKSYESVLKALYEQKCLVIYFLTALSELSFHVYMKTYGEMKPKLYLNNHSWNRIINRYWGERNSKYNPEITSEILKILYKLREDNPHFAFANIIEAWEDSDIHVPWGEAISFVSEINFLPMKYGPSAPTFIASINYAIEDTLVTTEDWDFFRPNRKLPLFDEYLKVVNGARL